MRKFILFLLLLANFNIGLGHITSAADIGEPVVAPTIHTMTGNTPPQAQTPDNRTRNPAQNPDYENRNPLDSIVLAIQMPEHTSQSSNTHWYDCLIKMKCPSCNSCDYDCDCDCDCDCDDGY